MAECVVISDEITGGSSVAAMLEKNRCTVCSLISNKGLKDPATAKFDWNKVINWFSMPENS